MKKLIFKYQDQTYKKDQKLKPPKRQYFKQDVLYARPALARSLVYFSIC